MVISRGLDTAYDVIDSIEGEAVQGAARSKVLIGGDEIVLEKMTFENGAFSSPHTHTYEIVSYVLRGRGDVTIGKETFRVNMGDSFRCGKGVPHSLKAVEGEITVIEAHGKI